MLLDLRVLMMSSWAASPNCLVRFSDMLCRPKPSRWKAASGSLWSGLPELLTHTQERQTHNLPTTAGTIPTRLHPPVILTGRLFGPRRRPRGGYGDVVVGAGRRLVGEVGRQQRRTVVLDHDRVVLGHVDGRRQLVVSCKRRKS